MSTDDSAYTIRLFEPGDEEGFLDLFDVVFDGGNEDWFRWKYLESPYVSHVPIFVAERDGEIVGARPYMPFRLRAGEETPLGLQTGDTMVHPDHQRNGLFTRMTQRSFDYYGDMPERVLTFSVPNALSRPGYLKLGCREVGRLPTHYRIQNPASFVDGALSRFAAPTAPVVKRLLARRRDRVSPDADVDVTRHGGVPAERFASLYERSIPARIHALRDERFYDWRFSTPDWSYEAFTAATDGESDAGVVVGRREHEGSDTVVLTDVVPLVGGDERRRGLEAILDRVVDEYADADVIVAMRSALPRPVLRAYGFLADDELPLSKLSTPTVLISRVFDGSDDPPWTLAGHDLAAPESWLLTFAEHNTH